MWGIRVRTTAGLIEGTQDGGVAVFPFAAQALLRAGELDELELHVVPVLLGQGRRLFDGLPPEHVELDLVRRLIVDGVAPVQRVMHLRNRVRLA